MINILILLISIFLYIFYGSASIIYILFSSILTYLTTKFMNDKNKKLLFIITLLINLSLLIFFKLYTFNGMFGLLSSMSIIVPIGISYYTFELTAYLYDVYSGKYEPEKNIFKFLLFILYYPCLLMGPINRYDELSKTLFVKRRFTVDNLVDGLLRIMIGLFKKFIIATRTAFIINFITVNDKSGAYVLFACIVYSVQLYADFSGGIDMVIGLSKIFGIELTENFEQPYFSESIKEFWRRWHITLSSWFRDYVYIPLGGNRKGKLRGRINVLIVFILSGLWHGLGYFWWGLFHGLVVALYPKTITHRKYINIPVTFIMVSILWIFFIYPTGQKSLLMLSSIFAVYNYADFFKNISFIGLEMPEMIVLIVSTIVLLIYDIICYKKKDFIFKLKKENKYIIICILLLVIAVFGVYGLDFNVSEFIYSKF